MVATQQEQKRVARGARRARRGSGTAEALFNLTGGKRGRRKRNALEAFAEDDDTGNQPAPQRLAEGRWPDNPPDVGFITHSCTTRTWM